MPILWRDFVASVNDRITVDADRLGPIQDGITRKRKDAVRDLQHHIPAMRQGHESTYRVADLSVYGSAHAMSLPEACRPIEAYVYDASCQCIQKPLWPFPWENRNELRCGAVPAGRAWASINPQATTMIVFPALEDDDVLQLFWDGIKETFADTDSVPFTEMAAEAVAAYVKSYVAREVDKDRALSAEYRAEYLDLRRTLYVSLREQSNSLIIRQPPAFLNCAPATCTDVEADAESTEPLPLLTLVDNVTVSDFADAEVVIVSGSVPTGLDYNFDPDLYLGSHVHTGKMLTWNWDGEDPDQFQIEWTTQSVGFGRGYNDNVIITELVAGNVRSSMRTDTAVVTFPGGYGHWIGKYRVRAQVGGIWQQWTDYVMVGGPTGYTTSTFVSPTVLVSAFNQVATPLTADFEPRHEVLLNSYLSPGIGTLHLRLGRQPWVGESQQSQFDGVVQQGPPFTYGFQGYMYNKWGTMPHAYNYPTGIIL
jgi:hypothetical protein